MSAQPPQSGIRQPNSELEAREYKRDPKQRDDEKSQATAAFQTGPPTSAGPRRTIPIPIDEDDDDDDDAPFQKPAKPGRSRPLNEHERWESIKANTSLGLCIAMPLLMIIPPRKLDGYTAAQGIMLLWAASEQLEMRTGKDLMWHSERPWRWGLGKIRGAVNPLNENGDAASSGELAMEGRRRLREPMAMPRREDGQGTSVVGEFQRYTEEEDEKLAEKLDGERRRIVNEVQMAMREENSVPGGYWDKMKTMMWTRSDLSMPNRGREG